VYQTLLRNAHFFEFLFRCDQDMAAEARQGGCPRCGGRLHQANYPRKPRGGAVEIGSRQALRLSFCCSREGCRGRVLPPSVRFLGPRVYVGAAVILAAAMRQGSSPWRVKALGRLLGVSRRSLQRWRAWWQAIFPETAFWNAARGRLRSPIFASDLPRALLKQFSGDPSEQLYGVLRWLTPLAGDSSRSARVIQRHSAARRRCPLHQLPVLP
jgi:hypothetical protein